MIRLIAKASKNASIREIVWEGRAVVAVVQVCRTG